MFIKCQEIYQNKLKMRFAVHTKMKEAKYVPLRFLEISNFFYYIIFISPMVYWVKLLFTILSTNYYHRIIPYLIPLVYNPITVHNMYCCI